MRPRLGLAQARSRKLLVHTAEMEGRAEIFSETRLDRRLTRDRQDHVANPSSWCERIKQHRKGFGEGRSRVEAGIMLEPALQTLALMNNLYVIQSKAMPAEDCR
jgi:hypothetical protein